MLSLGLRRPVRAVHTLRIDQCARGTPPASRPSVPFVTDDRVRRRHLNVGGSIVASKNDVFAITLGQRALGFGATTMEGLLNLAEWTDRSDNKTDWPRRVLEDRGVWGSVDACAEKLGRWIDAGATYVTLRLTTWDPAGQFKLVNEQLIPRLRERIRIRAR